MTRTKLVVGGLIAFLLLVAPLVFLVTRMFRPANRVRLAAASWPRGLVFLLVPAVAWIWTIARANRISVNINTNPELVLAVLWLVVIYLIWFAAPVAAITWIVLKLMDRGFKRGPIAVVMIAGMLLPAIAGAQDAWRSKHDPPASATVAQMAPPHTDPWFGIDKVKHFFMSVFVESVTYSALQAAHVHHRTALGTAIGATLAVGIGREIHDSRVPGNLFSVRDLTWDAIGTTAGAVLLSHTIR
jgi:uncharacterized protein YfiM (DUF2279 family)